MRINLKIKTMVYAVVAGVLSPFTAFAQCPPSALSSNNSTVVSVDSGVPTVDPLVDFPNNVPMYTATCMAARDDADATLTINFQGVDNIFNRGTQFSYNNTNGTCQLTYDNPAANPNISNPFTIDFPSLTEDCNYQANGVLPVELTQLKVKEVKNGVQIDWATVQELNNDYFEVLHTASVDEEWQSVGTVRGAGTSISPEYYTLTHDRPVPGKNYYLLQQTDYDGTVNLSQLQIITIESEQESLELFPNPAQNALTLRFDNEDYSVKKVQIFDTAGKLLSVTEVTETTQLDVSELKKGFYILQMSDSRRTVSRSFVKQ